VAKPQWSSHSGQAAVVKPQWPISATHHLMDRPVSGRSWSFVTFATMKKNCMLYTANIVGLLAAATQCTTLNPQHITHISRPT